jgi:hypothetical protein
MAANILSTLPTELLDRTFSFLVQDKQTIANSRLVCTSFRELSTPYLLTRVVFARRVATLEKLIQVVENPTFRKHITELIYDASWYCRGIAADWPTYVDKCNASPQSLDDNEYQDSREDDIDRVLDIRKRLREAAKDAQRSPGYSSTEPGA